MNLSILAHPNYNIPYPSNGVGPFSGLETAPPMYEQQPQQVDIEDIPVMFSDDDYSKYYTPPHVWTSHQYTPVMISDDDYSKYYTPPHVVWTTVTSIHLS